MSPLKHRILYVMHVDWRWIKQRPHFMAEELSRRTDRILVLYVPTWRRSRVVSAPSTIQRFPIPVVPRWTSWLGRLWNRTIGRAAVWLIALVFRPTVTW